MDITYIAILAWDGTSSILYFDTSLSTQLTVYRDQVCLCRQGRAVDWGVTENEHRKEDL